MRKLLALTLAVLMLATPVRLLACIWDHDTIAMERERFPEAHELIAGLLVRHSPAYYAWRIQDREATPLADRTPADYDDIAVAYDKLGRQDEAIAVMLAKIERWPDEGRYESEANLGTFHIHAGAFEAGLVHIKKAIEINPEAHFGREVYQQRLVEYVLAVRAAEGAEVLPLHFGRVRRTNLLADPQEDAQGRPRYLAGFPAFVLYTQSIDESEHNDELDRAVKGILGMMRFGHHDSPVLLEALANLMLAVGYGEDAKMLACRAYLKASYETDDPDASAEYRRLAEHAIQMHEGLPLQEVEADLREEIARGDAFFAQIEADERAWATAGKDLDAEFAAKYYQAPLLVVAQAGGNPGPWGDRMMSGVMLAILGLLVAGVALAFLWFLRHMRLASASATPQQPIDPSDRPTPATD